LAFFFGCFTLRAATSGDFEYTDNGTSITITKYRGTGGAVIIPSSIDSKPVTTIGDYAFSFRTGLTNVTILNGVTAIGANAFYGCYKLTSVIIPSGVTAIGAGAFNSCFGLTSVTLPSGVTSIGAHAFSSCFKLTSVTIPSSVTSIGAGAFSACTGLTSVTILGSVTSIGDTAFVSCTKLTRILFVGNAPTSFGRRVFGSEPSCEINYYENAAGFTSPTWKGQRTHKLSLSNDHAPAAE